MRREYEMTVAMLDNAYSSVDRAPEFPVPIAARISMSLFEGLGIMRLIDPAAYTEETVTQALQFLYDTIGVDSPVEQPSEATPAPADE
jgi:hypothetical protein